jgi:hypothetical protein
LDALEWMPWNGCPGLDALARLMLRWNAARKTLSDC